MAQRYFVQLKLGSKSFEPTKISTEGCCDIDDFKEAIKAKFSKKLESCDASDISLFEADGTTKISPMDSIDQLYGKKMPLVVVVEAVEGILMGLERLVDTESSLSVLQIEDNKTEIRKLKESNSKLQETVSNYVQKAETVQISRLTIEKLEKDGFTLIATSVDSINNSDYQISDRFHKFQWPVKNNEKDKRNKEAYLEYLTAFTESFNRLQVKISIESPHLNTVVGIEPYHLNGEADLYVIPKACRLICRNQLSMVFEMKPNEITSNNLAQAIGYVIAANSLFDVPGRPSPVGVLSDFIDQWYLIWIGKEGEVFYAGMEEDSNGGEKILTRLTAMYYVKKHLENYNQLLKDEKSKKRRAENFGWAFDGFEAGTLKKQKILVVQDNMRDLLETSEEVALYDMKKRMLDTPLFQIPPSAEEFSYFS